MSRIVELFANDGVYYFVASLLILMVMFGIYLMSKVEKARFGNGISALSFLLAVVITLFRHDLVSVWALYGYLAVGAILGLWIAAKVKMIATPQLVATLNGFGGLASTIVGGYALFQIGADGTLFGQVTATIALQIGMLTFVGSLVAALKLARKINQQPVALPHHSLLVTILLALMASLVVLAPMFGFEPLLILFLGLGLSSVFGLLFTLRIGGADMPITISLLNSLSGVAGALSGLAIGDLLLVSFAGIVGASGLVLTQIMCQAMNRKLFAILLGNTSTPLGTQAPESMPIPHETQETTNPYFVIKQAKQVIIVPGYGMAIAQAQYLVKELTDYLKANGATVKFAIHPVAGRMPGHMNVLLAEVDIDYDDLYEMELINAEFQAADATLVIGANDVLNPAARSKEGTPIYGMPILNVDQAKEIFIFNYDLKPGYSGVPNSLYQKPNVHFFLGNAKDTLRAFLDGLTT